MTSAAPRSPTPSPAAAEPLDARFDAFAQEIDHRCKNLLAQVQAIADQTLRRSASPEDFVEAFSGRLQALARAHELLGRGRWADIDLRHVAADALASFEGVGRRVRIDGPAMLLSAETAAAFHMAFHELVANAVRHGALASPEGRVELAWRADLVSKVLRLTWREFGGPPPAAERRNGFGLRLLTTGVARGLGADSRVDFRPAGFLFGLTAPLSANLACG